MQKCAFGTYANSEGPDQPAHPCSLILAFTVCFRNHWDTVEYIAVLQRSFSGCMALLADMNLYCSHIMPWTHFFLAWPIWYSLCLYVNPCPASLSGSVGCAVRLETRRSGVQPPPRSATFFRGDWSWNIFYGHSLPSADSRRAVVSFWRKNVHNTG